ncbi:MAG: hypothetical protein GX429_10075 [Bacteroidales bacterium]|nr:hypothetical protein [Bacteroidales bacterium]
MIKRFNSLTHLAFQNPPRFLELYLVSTFLFLSQWVVSPLAFADRLCFLNLPITFGVYDLWRFSRRITIS